MRTWNIGANSWNFYDLQLVFGTFLDYFSVPWMSILLCLLYTCWFFLGYFMAQPLLLIYTAVLCSPNSKLWLEWVHGMWDSFWNESQGLVAKMPRPCWWVLHFCALQVYCRLLATPGSLTSAMWDWKQSGCGSVLKTSEYNITW